MIEVHEHRAVAELRLQRPPVNALNLELVEGLISELQNQAKNGAKAIVISGKEGLFSGGLDVPELLQQSRNTMRVFWGRFFAMTQSLVTSPVPVIAAITGHSPAGGAVIAIHCDYRVAAAGDFRIGLNEVQVGLAVPPQVLKALEFLVGSRQAALLATTGRMVPPEDALALGLVDEVVASSEVVARAVAVAEEWTQLWPDAMNHTRLAARRALVHQPDQAEIEALTEGWFSDETRQALQALVASLGK